MKKTWRTWNPLIMKFSLSDDTRMTSIKIVKLSKPPTSLSSYVQDSSTSVKLGRQISNEYPHLQMITKQLKGNIILGWLLYFIKSFFQVGFRFQHQLIINLVWFSIDFSSFSWSQSRPQSNFKKLKISFSLSSYSGKTCWSQGWTEASLSTLQSTCFICIKRKQTMGQQPHRTCEWTKSNQNKKN